MQTCSSERRRTPARNAPARVRPRRPPRGRSRCCMLLDQAEASSTARGPLRRRLPARVHVCAPRQGNPPGAPLWRHTRTTNVIRGGGHVGVGRDGGLHLRAREVDHGAVLLEHVHLRRGVLVLVIILVIVAAVATISNNSKLIVIVIVIVIVVATRCAALRAACRFVRHAPDSSPRPPITHETTDAMMSRGSQDLFMKRSRIAIH